MDTLDRALQSTPRSEFLPENVVIHANKDRPLDIGHGQTNSQPSTVRLMLKWLDVQPGDNVLDVGSGSGWTTALLAHIVGAEGSVEATERIPELMRFGQENCKRLGIKNVSFHYTESMLGWPPGAPYDRILVSASARQLPHELIDQLKLGGKMVIPVGNEILEITASGGNKAKAIHHPGFLFVPLRYRET